MPTENTPAHSLAWQLMLAPLQYLTQFSGAYNGHSRLPSLSKTVQTTHQRVAELETTPIDKLDPESVYEVGFSQNHFLEPALRFLGEWAVSRSVKHASVAIRKVQDEEAAAAESPWLLIGRQSPYLSSRSPYHQDHSWSAPLNTHLDNEAFYDIFSHSAFRIRWVPGTYVQGKHLLKAISSVNESICKKEPCAMANSNCYTGAIALLWETLEAHQDEVATTDRQQTRQQILAYIRELAGDNLGIGVYNHPQLHARLKAVMDTVEVGETSVETKGTSPPKKPRQTFG